MDLSNLRTSLREEEASSQRRTAHLRAAEDELNAFFRSSALGLTTLYRQGVAATKSSYEKGYAHALAHVLELWEKDRDWLKGYLQRRIEAIEAADAEDEPEEVQMDQRQQQPQQQQQGAGPSFLRSPSQGAARQAQTPTDSPRQSNKRSRNAFHDLSASSHRSQDDANSERRALHRVPHNSTSSRFPSSTNFASSSFNFSAPLSYPSSFNAAAAATSASSPIKSRPLRLDAPVVKTSNPATSKRRLQKLKGLRAGRADRVVEIERRQDDEQDEILPDGVAAEDADAWTDDDGEGHDENSSPAAKRGAGGRGKKAVVWAERAAASGGPSAAHTPQQAEGKVLERLDRRKRRRTRQTEDIAMGDEAESSAEVSREEDADQFAYHS
ncbi:hypothetical protein PHSY_001411 [Pseudozyma hubeiensis SY62]|uniref:Uncharacterized protein n=1 Tax=Pseudozyma hubeiensis (strain SY62) TaxID=1305764 RepID=R9NYT5_PSEHS|nr:hypothetical protein PHSY_001411 [Pseudozyma hubeiensis SY62]GAC93846.1 hypothetical protein PHSY_001411 [Pseudozyma hubeiensis SY62]